MFQIILKLEFYQIICQNVKNQYTDQISKTLLKMGPAMHLFCSILHLTVAPREHHSLKHCFEIYIRGICMENAPSLLEDLVWPLLP